MKKDEAMVTQLTEVFSQQAIQACLESESQANFYICDSPHDDVNEKTFIAITGNEQGFKISNPNQKTIYHLPLDHCFCDHLATYQGQRCDCIIFDDTYFCFAELKLNVRKPKKATDKCGDALKQLITTIEFFRNSFQSVTKDFLDYNLEAYVVMQRKIYPRHPTWLKDKQTEFLEQYGVELYEKNEKEF